MMAKIVLVALVAFVAIQLSHGAPKPDEAVSVKSEAATEVPKKLATDGTALITSATLVAKEVEVKVGADAVEAVEKSTAAAEPAKEVVKEVAKA